MTNLTGLRLSDIMPARVKTPETLALDAALSPELQEINDAIIEAIIMPRIDEMPEDIVDLLAWQLHVDFYEPLGLNLDKKRALVKSSIIWHRHKGTKYAVEAIVRLLFYPEFRVEEWFEYGGEPYFFRAVVGGQPTSSAKALGELIGAIWATKNERSWLEYIRFVQEINAEVRLAGAFEELTEELFALADLPGEIGLAPQLSGALDEYTLEEIGGNMPPSEINVQLHLASGMYEHIKEDF